MSTEAVGAATDSQVSKSDNSRTKLAADMEMFLGMLTAQLRNQDPLSPMDSTEFTNQLVMFAEVEQQISSNQNLETLIGYQKANQVSSAVGYLGTEVEFAGNQLPYDGGEARIAYSLSDSARQSAVLIKDATGRIVKTFEGAREAGRHEIVWDGLDDNGNQVQPGTFKVEVAAVGGDTTIETETFISATVTGVTADEDTVTLSLGGVEIPLQDVRSVTQARSQQS